MAKGKNYNKFWNQAEKLIKAAGLKPKNFKRSSNWNNKADLKNLRSQLKAGTKKASDDSTFKTDQGKLEVKVKDWMTGANVQQVAKETGAQLPAISKSSPSGYASNRASSSPGGGWISGGSTRTSDSGATPQPTPQPTPQTTPQPTPQPTLQPKPQPSNTQTGSTDITKGTGVGQDEDEDVDLSIGPYTALSMHAGKAASGIKSRKSPWSTSVLKGKGTKALSRKYKNLSINP